MAKVHKQLNKQKVIPHIKKCFAYAVSQNRGNSVNLAKHLNLIPDHLYDRHENCPSWGKPKEKQTVKFTDELLYNELKIFFAKYARNAEKFSISASSQGNESFNNFIAHKAPKNICLSRSKSCDYRVADSVYVKNDGEECIINYKKILNLPKEVYTSQYIHNSDKKRLYRKNKEKKPELKKKDF